MEPGRKEEDQHQPVPATEPPKRKNFRTDMGSVGPQRRSLSSVGSSGSRRSGTAASSTSSGGIQTLPLATSPTLKGPYEGQKIAPCPKVGSHLEMPRNILDLG